MSRPQKHCAIYTRKSSQEGLDQEFNSLDAQREACEAYVVSQKSEGWKSQKMRYDDGGFSGGTMERPALAQLLVDIAKGKIDVVVVYKIDRLTRALADFARIVELFDKHNVSFVSVTQAFNTTSSMGRLTLNVLLSFAQFEREVTGERIRDKIAASKAKGMWMGGTLPLGYDRPQKGSRALAVNEPEAKTVRVIFRTYLEQGSTHTLTRWLEDQGIRSKHHVTLRGKEIGGKSFSRGALFHLLKNRTYLGQIKHRDKIYPGLHEAIVPTELFERVQDQLNSNARRRSTNHEEVAHAPLTGRIFDEDGYPMSPTFSYGRKSKLYRYYVSAPLQQGHRRPQQDSAIRRIAAAPLEAGLARVLSRTIGAPEAGAIEKVMRIEFRRKSLHCLLPIKLLPQVRENLQPEESVEIDPVDAQRLRLIFPAYLFRRGGRTMVIDGEPRPASPDPVLIKSLRAAHAMVDMNGGKPTINVAPGSPHQRQLIRLAFLAPDLQRAILNGRQPSGFTLAHFLKQKLPIEWIEQARVFGFSS